MRPPPRFEEMQAVRSVPGHYADPGLEWDRAYVVGVEWQEPGKFSPTGQLIPPGWHYEICLTDDAGDAYELWFAEDWLQPASA